MNDSGSTTKKMLKVYGYGALIALAVTAVFVLLFALVLTYFDLPDSAAAIMSVCSLALGSLSGGIFTAKINRKNGLVCGLICGLLTFTVTVLFSLIFNFSSFSVMTPIKAAAAVIGAALGGILGVNLKAKRKII